MRKLKGYVSSRNFMGERAPQHIQNIIIRDYCTKNNYKYVLSATEYAFEESFFMLNNVLEEINKYDGIVAYSLFQLPSDIYDRNKIFKKILSKNKQIHFANESMSILKLDDALLINDIWEVKKYIKFSPQSI